MHTLGSRHVVLDVAHSREIVAAAESDSSVKEKKVLVGPTVHKNSARCDSCDKRVSQGSSTTCLVIFNFSFTEKITNQKVYWYRHRWEVAVIWRGDAEETGDGAARSHTGVNLGWGFDERRALKETETCKTDAELAVVAVALERIIAVVRLRRRYFCVFADSLLLHGCYSQRCLRQ